MIIDYLLFLVFLTGCGAATSRQKWRPPHRGASAPVPAGNGTDSHLWEGDIAQRPLGSGSSLNSYRVDNTSSLWLKGRVPYRIAEYEWDGITDPVFLDADIEKIHISLKKIEAGVPCIDFM